MSNPEITYESLLEDKDFIDSTYYVLQDLGDNVAYNSKEILDTFLTKKRYFDTNIGATINIGGKMKELSDDSKSLLRFSLDKVDKLPSFYESGGAPTGAALTDYFLAGLFDPTNLASAVAGAFTFGAGGVAIQAAKEGAKLGIRKAIQAKVKAALPVLAVEGAIAGTGGAVQSIVAQDVEKDIGLELDPLVSDSLVIGDIDLARVGLQTVAEGTLSPIVGSILGKGISTTGKAVAKPIKYAVDNYTPVELAANFLTRNFLPTAGLEDTSRRLVERGVGQSKSLNERATEVQLKFSDAVEKENVNVDLQNKALEGDSDALATLSVDAPKTLETINEFRNLVSDATNYGLESKLPSKIKDIFKSSNRNANYVRNVPDAYYATKGQRKPFKEFLKDNPNILEDYKKLVLSDKDNYGDVYNRIVKEDGTLVDNIDDVIKKEVEIKYTPTRLERKIAGPYTKKEEELPEAIKTIIGYNNTPAFRILDSINAITDTTSKTNIAADIGNYAIKNNLGIKSSSEGLARQSFKDKEVTRLVDSDENSIINLPEQFIDDSLKDIYIEKKYADQLKELLQNDFGRNMFQLEGGLGTALRFYGGTQAFAKAGKTVYSPIALIRNALGAAGYTGISGNFRSIYREVFDRAKTLTNKEFKKEFTDDWTSFEKAGLRGSNIDLNQAKTRFEDVVNAADERSAAGKLLYFGKTGRAARKVYGGTDDVAKFAVFKGEKLKAEKILNEFSPEEQTKILNKFKEDYNLKNVPETQIRKDYINEQAAVKTANFTPIYDRIPKILEKLRVLPLIGTFTAYPAERLRNTYQILKTSTDEIREGFETGNKELQKVGISRLAQFYAGQGAVYTVAYGLNELTGFSDIAEDLRDYLLPSYKKDNAIVVTRVDKDGNPYIRDLSYLNPDSHLAGIIMPMILKASRGEDVSKDLDKGILDAGIKLLDPFTSPSLALDGAQGLLGYVKSGGDIELLRGTVKALEPGFVKLARDLVFDSGVLDDRNSSIYNIDKFLNPRYYGQVPERADDVSELLDMNSIYPVPGLKEEKIDLQTSTAFALRELGKNSNKNWSDFSANLKSTLSDPSSVYEIDSLLKSYDEALREQYVFQQGLDNLYNDLNKFLPRNKILKIFNNNVDLRNTALSKKDLQNIFKSKSISRNLSDQNKYWLDLNKNLFSKTGESYRSELINLRDNFRNLESFYNNRDLRLDPPDLVIGEE